MTPGSDTEKNKRGRGSGKPFTKGDPRINRNGRPKGFDQLREMALRLCEEIWTSKSGDKARAVEVILRKMMADPRQMADFLEIAYGKVPTRVEVSTPTEPIVITQLAPGEKPTPTDGGGT